MSSSMTGSLVNHGKLLVHIAENGYSFEFDCDETTAVVALMRYVETVSGIKFNDQLVLSFEVRLEPQRRLSTYKLLSVDGEIFIFNKARLQTNSPSPPPELIDALEVADPPLPASMHDPHPLDDAPDLALKVLPSYESQFWYHYQKGHAIYSRTQVKYEICQKVLRELKVQEKALEVARDNLNQYYRVLNQYYQDFTKRYVIQQKMHYDLILNFGRDLDKLRSIMLHPSLQTASRKCLSDFVKEDNLRKVVENCNNSHRTLEKKVSDFKQVFGDIKRKVEELFTSKSPVPVRNLEVTIKDHQRFINEQKSILLSLSKDVKTVKKLVDDCLSSQFPSPLHLHDAVSALSPMYDVHDKNHLPRMQESECLVSQLFDFCKDKKNEMNIFVHNYMQKVTYISYFIKDAKFQFPAFKEAMVRQDEIFMDLKVVHGIGPAYRACLAEVVRRKASMKLYMGMAGQLAEKLATRRESEVRRREEFLKAHGLYLPKDILSSMGLYDTPNQCDVNVAPFDTNLLDIDIYDVDRYAPEYLVGLPVKSEKHGSLKGSLTMSSDSSLVAEAGEITADAFEKDDFEEQLDGGDVLDIAGTSKMEVENAKLKAELASAIAQICFLFPETEYELLDDSKLDRLLKDAAEKTAEALQMKDEYGKYLQSMLKEKQLQCSSYEKRVQELEKILFEQYLPDQKPSVSKADVCKPEITASGEVHMPYVSTSKPMDEVSCISSSLDAKLGFLIRQASKGQDGADVNMLDSSGTINTQLDSSMTEPQREELPLGDKEGNKMIGQVGMSLTHSSTAESMPGPLNASPPAAACDPEVSDHLVLELQAALAEKTNQLSETEAKLKASVEEVSLLNKELERSRKLLDESQMNGAHLENCLHEARKEAQTHLCAADRRALEYSALRTSAVKMSGLFERLKSSVNAKGGVSAFNASLRALAQSLANSINDSEEKSAADFSECIQNLADKVSFLSRHREELLQKYLKLEAAHLQLQKELEEKTELVATLYKKHQLEKQVSKERISFNRLEVHEIAAFVRNSSGHYEAINRNCSEYFLSAESVALFTDNLPTQPSYIVGQVVHIERQTVKPLPHSRVDQIDQLTSDNPNPISNSNSYGLPIGCEYFVVTVAMLPDTSFHSTTAS